MSDDAPPAPDIDDFEELYHDAPCGYLSVAPDGRIAHANRRIAAWTGHAAADLAGRRLADLLSVPARVLYETSVAPTLRLGGSVDEVALDFLTRDGSKVPCLLNAAERRDAAGAPLFTRLAVFRATGRRRYERALVDANAAERENSALREQFIAVLGHDLRNPLAAIGGGVRLLGRQDGRSAQDREVLRLMQGSLNRATELVDNVLDFARGRLGGGIALTRGVAVPLAPVLDQVVAEITALAPDRVFNIATGPLPPVDCDPVRVGQLFSNLLGNAVAHGAPDRAIRIRAGVHDQAFVLSVANGGAPIGPAAMERLFQPFFRGDIRPGQAGLGLGLHIAREIARAHGGELTVASAEEETCFTFTLPLNGSVANDPA